MRNFANSKINSFILASFPIFALIIRGWTSAILFFCLFSSLFFLIRNRSPNHLSIKNIFLDLGDSFTPIAVPFMLPIVCVALLGSLNQEFRLRDLDGPSRYVFALIIFTFLIRFKPNLEKYQLFCIGLMPIFTALLVNFFNKSGWATLSRTTIYYIDPITFGSLCLTFGLLSLTILCDKSKNIYTRLFYGLSMLCGFYLSIKSESRTGWLAVPIVLFLIIKIRFGVSFLKTLFLCAWVIFIGSLALHQSSDIARNRMNQLAQDVHSYKWNEINEASSTGERISLLRIGSALFLQKPLTGWGNTDFSPAVNEPKLSNFATQDMRTGVKGGGFHNEFLNNAVKYGVLGLVFTLLLFVGPGIFFLRILKRQNNNLFALLGIIYITAQAISCLSYQVLDFKFTASLYALMVITLAYSAIRSNTLAPNQS